jgi:hypothetical protein
MCFNPKNYYFKLSEIWSRLFIPDPDPDFLPIPDLGVKKAPDPGSATLKVLYCNCNIPSENLYHTLSLKQRSRCEAALARTDGDVGRATEELLAGSFNIVLSHTQVPTALGRYRISDPALE